MKFQKKLYEGLLLDRYKRFFADVEYKDEKITIHVPNTGSLKTVIEKPTTKKQKCWFSLHGDETKKLKGTLEAVQSTDGAWVGVNTSNPNRLVTEAAKLSIESGKPFLPHWKGFGFYKPEFKINKESRLDGAFLKNEADLENPKSKKHFIEIKNTTYKSIVDGKTHAQFPDAVTERGQKHLIEMMKLIDEGHSCELIFCVQRDDVDYFSPAVDIDPEYAKLLAMAQKKGMILSPLICELSQSEIILTNKILKIKL
jgi:sugar fermentation stimulation protein A